MVGSMKHNSFSNSHVAKYDGERSSTMSGPTHPNHAVVITVTIGTIEQ